MIIEMPLQKVSQPIGFYRDHTQYIHTSSGAYVIFQLSKKHQVLTEFYWLKNVIPTLQIALIQLLLHELYSPIFSLMELLTSSNLLFVDISISKLVCCQFFWV